MKVLDVNVVVAAARDEHPLFPIARPWLEALVANGDAFSVPDVVCGSLVRLLTDRRVFRPPTEPNDAFAFLRALRSQPGHVTLEPGARHLDHFEHLVERSHATGKLVPDAQLAAVAREHGAAIVSFDHDFARFRDIDWINPSEAPPGTRSGP